MGKVSPSVSVRDARGFNVPAMQICLRQDWNGRTEKWWKCRERWRLGLSWESSAWPSPSEGHSLHPVWIRASSVIDRPVLCGICTLMWPNITYTCGYFSAMESCASAHELQMLKIKFNIFTSHKKAPIHCNSFMAFKSVKGQFSNEHLHWIHNIRAERLQTSTHTTRTDSSQHHGRARNEPQEAACFR